MLDLLTMSSSDELLLIIVDKVRNDKTNSSAQSQIDLVNLSLTCRRFQAVAYEVLYKSPAITQPRIENSAFSGSYLVRTLLERPDLAKRVRNLEVSLTGTSRRVGHRASCPFGSKKYCQCDWYNVHDPSKSRLLKLDRENGTLLYDRKWLKNIRYGKERAVFGMLLTCTLNLQGLSIYKRGDYKLFDGDKGFDSGQLRSGRWSACSNATKQTIPK
jgi:hypothetical protein